uniref:Uncharacterized protein n=1 Tax=Myotis myotis TaxID=51298 RepID=A0A7J7UPN4_MYOMY|nr:hypothetical protein mMyoMyo1_008622 [Myotis myotis]
MGRLRRHPLSRTEQGQSGGWGAFPCQEQSRADREVVARPPVTHRATGQSGRLGAAPYQADPSAGRPHGSADPGAGRHITLLLYRIEAWCMGGGWLVCPEGCPRSGWGSPLGCLASLGEGLRARFQAGTEAPKCSFFSFFFFFILSQL